VPFLTSKLSFTSLEPLNELGIVIVPEIVVVPALNEDGREVDVENEAPLVIVLFQVNEL
jgi:hypothetical protein